MLNVPGCICLSSGPEFGFDVVGEGNIEWRINPQCPYHLLAAEHPEDHSIPWNCPTFWDGCNCEEQQS